MAIEMLRKFPVAQEYPGKEQFTGQEWWRVPLAYLQCKQKIDPKNRQTARENAIVDAWESVVFYFEIKLRETQISDITSAIMMAP